MAISGSSGYISTGNSIITSWTEATNTVGLPGIILPDGTTVAEFTGLLEGLESLMQDVANKANLLDLAGAYVSELRLKLYEDLILFKRNVRTQLEKTKYAKTLHKSPPVGIAAGKMMNFVLPILSMWSEIDTATIPGFTGPLLIGNAMTRAAFESKVTNFSEALKALDEAEIKLKLARETRKELQKKVFAIMKKYREVIRARFDKDDPIVLSLPRLYPVPGSTPDPVIANWVWDETLGKAKLTWSASEAPNLTQYEVRWSPGSIYKTADDIVLANIMPDQPLEYLTTQGLTVPGAKSLFKIYVLVSTGNQKGSNTLKVVRPA